MLLHTAALLELVAQWLERGCAVPADRELGLHRRPVQVLARTKR